MQPLKQSFLDFKNISRFYETVKYLKWQQIYYRFFYPVKRFYFRPRSAQKKHIDAAFAQQPIKFPEFKHYKNKASSERYSFTFLNLSKSFGQKIDWDFKEYGKLWTFNLYYFDWLNDDALSTEFCLDTMLQFIDNKHNRYFYFHSYPASIRIINWIKFLRSKEVKNERVISELYLQAIRLYAFPEYEIMGNHLLENGFALAWAGLYFNEKQLITKGEQIISEQLKVQILDDGAHFERSISYHSLVLKNILELLFICKSEESIIYNYFVNILKFNASKALSYLFIYTNNGKYAAHFGDSNDEMLVSFDEIKNLAQNLGIICEDVQLKESGFRKLNTANATMLFNYGIINAAYQPGHIHADVFSFCLFVNNKPVIVDRGVSTYENNTLRQQEKGAEAHNTICIENENMHDVWSSFRIGRRADIEIIEDNDTKIEASHNGYFRNFGINHKRTIGIENNIFEIRDELQGFEEERVYFYIHFHPKINIFQYESEWKIEGLNCTLSIEGVDCSIENYDYCIGMNKIEIAKRLICKVRNSNTNIKINVFE